MTGDKVAEFDLTKIRRLLGANRLGNRAAGAESASGRGVDGRGYIALQNDALALGVCHRIRNGNCRKQRPGIRMQRIQIKRIPAGQLDDNTQVHDRHTAADMAYY